MIDLARGAIVLFAERGDYTAKPRPGLIVQHRATLADAPSITLCGITSRIGPAASGRVVIRPETSNGLEKISVVMIDKIATVRRERIRDVIGRIDDMELAQVDQALRRWLDL